jgi:hypothetical protein
MFTSICSYSFSVGAVSSKVFEVLSVQTQAKTCREESYVNVHLYLYSFFVGTVTSKVFEVLSVQTEAKTCREKSYGNVHLYLFIIH